jgi:hypothetical protein
MSSIPWESIEASTDIYIDTASLPPTSRIASPHSLTRTQVDILIDHIHSFQTTSRPNPLALRTKADMQMRLAAVLPDNLSAVDNTESLREEPDRIGGGGGGADDTESLHEEQGQAEDNAQNALETSAPPAEMPGVDLSGECHFHVTEKANHL